ncbi:MAG: hypothetical protein EA343_03010 [Nodularia sp. (in: Bacteria)]|nr:MAG: hypothetical protein EA343_02760 [Nodularia sp. (in: cyanobacteria)]TVP65615.1 MAG: hypothetical protein EA343_03010 [Nodularia sp. (in: cyanobacteria)]
MKKVIVLIERESLARFPFAYIYKINNLFIDVKVCCIGITDDRLSLPVNLSMYKVLCIFLVYSRLEEVEQSKEYANE